MSISWFCKRDSADPIPTKDDARDNIGSIELKSPKHGMFRIREPLVPILKPLLSLIPILMAGALWWYLTKGPSPEMRIVGPTILPSPSEVVLAFPSIWFDGALMRNIILSLCRVMSGFLIASAIALPLGVMMGACTRVSSTFSLVMTVLSYLPMPALVPLTMAWWGSGESQKIGFLALVTFSMLLPLVVRAIGRVDHKYILSAYSQGAGPWDVLKKVLIPIAAPEIYSGLRMCLGVGWAYIVLAEVIKASGDLGGVGNLIMVYHRLGHMSEVYLIVISIGIVGMALDRVCIILQRYLFPYLSHECAK